MNNVINLPTTQKPQTLKIKPFSVLVHWSESREFENDQLLDFAEFESKALKVALSNINCGYDKTKVTVTFENGDEYTCRLDLACNDTLNFSHYIIGSMAYYENQKAAGTDQAYLKNYAEANKMQQTFLLDLQAVANATTEEDRAIAKDEEAKAEKQAAAQKQREIEAEEKAKQAAVFYENLVIPEEAKAVIVATFTEYDTERSDPYADYNTTKTVKTIILAWSKHTRDLFSEMRKAAKNHIDTEFLSDKENSTEHREKYSMGKGYYLTDKEYNYAGWAISKHDFYRGEKADHVPVGEMAIPSSEPVKRKAKVKPAPVEISQGEQSEQLVLNLEYKPIQKTTHSKKGHDLFVVQLVERTNRDQFLKLCEIAKNQGGYYSKYTKEGAINGFQFLSLPAARAFCVLVGKADQTSSKPKLKALEKVGDFWTVEISFNGVKERKQVKAASKIEALKIAFEEFKKDQENEPEPTPPTGPKKAPQPTIKSHGDKLRAQAEKMQDNAEKELNAPRQENTHRRAGMAATARNRAYKDIAHAQLLNNIATAQDNGEAGALAGIKTKAHLLTLSNVFMGAIPTAHQERTGPDTSFNTPLERIKSGSMLSDFINHITIRDFYKTCLKKAGIISDKQLQGALLKYEALSGEAPKECPIKTAERALIGVKIEGYFPTPEAVRAVMFDHAELKAGLKVLEPSAGGGAIADDLRSAGCVVDCCEVSPSLREILQAKDHNIVDHNFLNLVEFGTYDRVIMNPPFEKGQDIDHVMHAFKMLKPGGVLVSVMGAGVEFNSNKKFTAFREWLSDNGGHLEKLQANSFKTGDRSTGVNTVLISLTAPIETTAPTINQDSEKSTTRADLSLGDHSQRVEEKRERASERAHKATQKSAAFYEQSKSLASLIPFGQPILIGHHSEKRSRRDADKIFNDMGKSVAESKKADYHAHKAQTIGSGGIASDDSEAVAKLKAKLKRLETAQDLMKTVNKIVKKYKDHSEQLKALINYGTSEQDAIKLLEPGFNGRVGYASYSISNNGATIRATKKRIEEVQALHNSKPIDHTGEGWTMSEEDGRICAFFNGKPCEEVRSMCKRHGFTWSRTRGAWVRKITANATYSAESLAEALQQHHGEPVTA